jgi:hypothetical protein
MRASCRQPRSQNFQVDSLQRSYVARRTPESLCFCTNFWHTYRLSKCWGVRDVPAGVGDRHELRSRRPAHARAPSWGCAAAARTPLPLVLSARAAAHSMREFNTWSYARILSDPARRDVVCVRQWPCIAVHRSNSDQLARAQASTRVEVEPRAVGEPSSSSIKRLPTDDMSLVRLILSTSS